MSYPFGAIEKKWQQRWLESKFRLWRAKDFAKQKKLYILDMFPYPSGEGLHTGHIEGYTGTDILSRYYRMRGFNVLHPMGWDAFGLPAENYALKMKKNPKEFVPKNIARFKKQLQQLGFSYDWEREIDTTDPDYYKWTQWLFIKMFEKGLAYEAEAPINFCPSCKTGLANEEIIDGRCERCGTETIIKTLKQWHLRITAYADRLLNDLDQLDWPESIKELQRHWIGRSQGYEVIFKLEDGKETIKTFTTRLDTIYGVTFLVLAPEHPLALKLTKQDYYLLAERYIKHAIRRDNPAELTGVFTGSYAFHPLTHSRLPIWISNYVLAHYGSGAIMAVPAHDRRDFNFAKKFSLPIEVVIEPANNSFNLADSDVELPFEAYGQLINSNEFNGLSSQEAIEKIGELLSDQGLAQPSVQYKLRDWIFSRQRYWGEPIPIIKCKHCGYVPVPEKDLPVRLPAVKSYQPTGTGESPLLTITHWVKVKCPKCKGMAERETNTMPQWAGSCWYYLRFIDPKNKNSFADKKKLKYWLPVDIYVGGAEHAVLHLLYARFWHKFLYDLKLVPTDEPFQKLVNQGTILGPDNQKMSKSKGNVVNPDELVKKFGADCLRLYEMFMGPFESTKAWNQKNIKGVFRFLRRIYLFAKKVSYERKKAHFIKNSRSKKPKERWLEAKNHLELTISKVTNDIERFKFNTAISALMEYLNLLEDKKVYDQLLFSNFIKLLFPFAPHLSQECWTHLGNQGYIDHKPWPKLTSKPNPKIKYTIIVQINGKKRTTYDVSPGIKIEDLTKNLLQDERIKTFIKNKPIVKTVYIKDRLINFVLAEKNESEIKTEINR
jgi:leucyl-tRNA synthetase